MFYTERRYKNTLIIIIIIIIIIVVVCGLVGLMVKASATRAACPEFDSCLRRGDFSRSGHTSDLTIGTAVATPARRHAL